MRMRPRVRPDLPPRLAESPKLLPAGWNELGGPWPVQELVDSRPAHRFPGSRERGRDEHRTWDPEALQNGTRPLVHRAVCVVEGDGHHPARLGARDGLGEGHSVESSRDQVPKLVLEL